MRIHAVEGNIVEVAPPIAEASVLWLRSGFNNRAEIARVQLPERYPGARLVNLAFRRPDNLRTIPVAVTPNFPKDPWRTEIDAIFRVEPVDALLRYVYIFANPKDGVGCVNVDEVTTLVKRCLARLTKLEVRRVAMIHIPLAERQQQENHQPFDRLSAQAMIEALREWDQQNPNMIDDVFLVDLTNGFKELL